MEGESRGDNVSRDMICVDKADATYLDLPVQKAKRVGECVDELTYSGPSPILPQSLHDWRRRGWWYRGGDGWGYDLARHDDARERRSRSSEAVAGSAVSPQEGLIRGGGGGWKSE